MLSPGIPILMYHQVGARPHPAFRKYTVAPSAFRTQMRWLAAAGYETVTPDQLLDARAGRGVLPRRPVMITFDDGFRECVDEALPVLRSHGFGAVFYLVAGLMGGTSRWLVPLIGAEFPLVDWETARELERAGFRCAAHSMTHPRLTDLDPDACRTELREPRQLLEEHLGRPEHHLAYPHGAWDEQVRALAEEAGYRTACSVRIGLSGPGDDALALHRVPVNGTDTLPDFVARLRTGHTVRETVRGAVGGAVGGAIRRLAGLGRGG